MWAERLCWRAAYGTQVFERANAEATSQEESYVATGAPDLDFTCTILVLGKSGVGKSSTINSIFGEELTPAGAFDGSTAEVRGGTQVYHGINAPV